MQADYQNDEVRKDSRRKIAVRVGFAIFFGTLVLTMLGFDLGTQLTAEATIDGKVLYGTNNHGDYLLILNNQIVSCLDMTDQFHGKIDMFDNIKKESNSNQLYVTRADSSIYITLKFPQTD